MQAESMQNSQQEVAQVEVEQLYREWRYMHGVAEGEMEIPTGNHSYTCMQCSLESRLNTHKWVEIEDSGWCACVCVLPAPPLHASHMPVE